MSEEQSFLDQALNGRVSLEEIDDFVDRWHGGTEPGELHEYLGMSWEEYGLWMSDPDMLAVICKARQRGQPLVDAVNDNVEQVRLGDAERLRTLRAWLRKQGKSA